MYELEQLPRADQPGLNNYNVVDTDRGLRLELQRRTQDTDRFWFSWEGGCVEFLAELQPSQPGTKDIALNVPNASLRERGSGDYVTGKEIEELRRLIPEALEAFWRMAPGPLKNFDKVIVKSMF